ncbi:MAG: hypothetical protein ACXVPU_14250 [Bacteroidia bacterium]
MKKLIILIAALLINTSAIFAEGGNNVQNAITAQLKVPADILKQNFEKVNIEFAMKANGSVSILNIDTQNEDLKKLIMEKFPQLDFSKIDDLPTGGYKIDIYFQTL